MSFWTIFVIAGVAAVVLILGGFFWAVWATRNEDELGDLPSDDPFYDVVYDIHTVSLTIPLPTCETGRTSETVEPLGGSMAQARYKELAGITDQLVNAGVSDDVIDLVKSAYQSKYPSAFTDTAAISDADFRKKTVEFTRRHLRRFPKAQGALVLSLKDLITGESTVYQS